jgi:hypothetical protein
MKTVHHLLTVVLVLISNFVFSQVQPGTDSYEYDQKELVRLSNIPTPGINVAAPYAKLLAESPKRDVTYQIIGKYRVSGNAYLFNTVLDAEVYAAGKLISFGEILFDTYSQEVRFIIPNETEAKRYNAYLIDSFIIHRKTDNVTTDLLFVSMNPHKEANGIFVQKLFKTSDYTLFKSYKSVLNEITNDHSPTDFRTFGIIEEYFYVNNSGKEDVMVKIKMNKNWLKNKFEGYPLALDYADMHSIKSNEEDFLLGFFSKLNK